jgi:sulfite exporter TauE/SafE
MTDGATSLLIAAWLTGVASGGHCLAMCGGIVGMLGVRAQPAGAAYALVLAAHVGRVTSYAIVGGLAGFAGSAVADFVLGAQALGVLRLAAALLTIVIGLQLILGRSLLRPLERGGATLWRHMAPHVRGWLPPRTPLRALSVGAVWGFIPCGLVYAELAVATAAGSALNGALIMAAFGLGTAMSLSVVAAVLQAVGLARLQRRTSGALLLLFGVWIALPVVLPNSHVESASVHSHAH